MVIEAVCEAAEAVVEAVEAASRTAEVVAMTIDAVAEDINTTITMTAVIGATTVVIEVIMKCAVVEAIADNTGGLTEDKTVATEVVTVETVEVMAVNEAAAIVTTTRATRIAISAKETGEIRIEAVARNTTTSKNLRRVSRDFFFF